jgi:hypothetical protein
VLAHGDPAAGEAIALADEPRAVFVFKLDREVVEEIAVVPIRLGESAESHEKQYQLRS